MVQLIKRYPVLTFFVLTTALGWIAVMVGMAVMPIDEEHEMTALHGILVFLIASPSIVGLVLTAVIDGRAGLKEMWSRVVRWRVRGVDLDAGPPAIITSDEVWWFYKPF